MGSHLKIIFMGLFSQGCIPITGTCFLKLLVITSCEKRTVDLVYIQYQDIKTDFLSSDKSPDYEITIFRLLLKFLSKYSHVQLFNSDLVDNRQFKKPF